MLFLYRILTVLAAPLLYALLWQRTFAGKEDRSRLRERFGHAQTVRRTGSLLWLHAASVGEALSALPLIELLLARRLDLSILVTTGTVSSARILADRLPARATHRFVPLDRPQWVGRFLDLWRPDVAVWIESELWPNLLLETARRGIPMALVNARLSARSYRRWRFAPRSIAKLLGCFQVILARDEHSAGFVRQLGARRVMCAGDLKQAAAALPAEETELARLRTAIGARPVWLTASSHPGEEAIALQVHQQLLVQFPNLLSVIAPRHAVRGDEIARLIASNGLRVARRALAAIPDGATDIYLADTMGEMGLIYRLSPMAFIGGSLAPLGGQNPLEPARLGCAILHGPNVGNFADIYAALDTAGAAQHIVDAASLAQAVSALLSDPSMATMRGRAGQAYAAQGGEAVLEKILNAVEPLLPPALDPAT